MTARSIPDGRVAAHFLCRKREKSCRLADSEIRRCLSQAEAGRRAVPSIGACFVGLFSFDLFFLSFFFLSGGLPVASTTLRHRARTPSGERASRPSRLCVLVCSACCSGHCPEKDELVTYWSACAHLQQQFAVHCCFCIARTLAWLVAGAPPTQRTECDTPTAASRALRRKYATA